MGRLVLQKHWGGPGGGQDKAGGSEDLLRVLGQPSHKDLVP